MANNTRFRATLVFKDSIDEKMVNFFNLMARTESSKSIACLLRDEEEWGYKDKISLIPDGNERVDAHYMGNLGLFFFDDKSTLIWCYVNFCYKTFLSSVTFNSGTDVMYINYHGSENCLGMFQRMKNKGLISSFTINNGEFFTEIRG